MKIAVTTENGQIFQHFGKCPLFTIYEVSEKQILSKSELNTSEHGHGALAGFLKANGVTQVICGGIGAGAKDALAGQGIALVCGITGGTDDAVQAFLAGKLQGSDQATCNHHDHGHEEGHECQCGHH